MTTTAPSVGAPQCRSACRVSLFAEEDEPSVNHTFTVASSPLADAEGAPTVTVAASTREAQSADERMLTRLSFESARSFYGKRVAQIGLALPAGARQRMTFNPVFLVVEFTLASPE
ncbi:hypothetical protein GCM10010401_06110 [Rarobacter faecitabidus]